MSEQHPHRATIQPIPQNAQRPLWSVMIPTYNCAKYLRETLLSVLAQDPGSEAMQIAVIDDHSTKDDPERIVDELGQGRIEFYQQPKNIGNTRNYATCLQKSRGKLIHLLHGDDCVRGSFYKRMEYAFDKEYEIGAAFCRQIFIDENSQWQSFSELKQLQSGILKNWLEQMSTIQIVQTPSIVVRRKVYEELGGFDHRLRFLEDWEMWVRIAAHHPVWYETEPLALYRRRSGSLTEVSLKNGENIIETYKAIEIYKTYLPEKYVNDLPSKSKKTWAFFYLESASQLMNNNQFDVAITQIKEILSSYRSIILLLKIIKIILLHEAKKIMRKLFVALKISRSPL